MTNLIAKVSELRELEAKDIPGKYTSDCPEYDYMVGVLNAAPKLLAALGKVQAGDAHTLDIIATFFELPKKGMSDASYRKDLEWAECLRRYADLAHLMEGNL